MQTELTKEEWERIQLETAERDQFEPRISAARYEAETGNLLLQFRDGQQLVAPTRLIPALAVATDKQLADVRPEERGAALFFDSLDVQFSTIALLRLIFQLPSQSDVARIAGSTKSPAKAAAARVNGSKGGRPRKQAATVQ